MLNLKTAINGRKASINAKKTRQYKTKGRYGQFKSR